MARHYIDRGTNETEASVMAMVALNPGQYLMSDIAKELGKIPSSISSAARGLASRGWLESGNSKTKRPNIAYKTLVPTDEFWSDYKRVVQVIHEFFESDKKLEPVFTNAITAKHELGDLKPESQEYLDRRVVYLGGIAVLGEHVDLHIATSGVWFAYEPGWRAIVDVQVSQIPAS